MFRLILLTATIIACAGNTRAQWASIYVTTTGNPIGVDCINDDFVGLLTLVVMARYDNVEAIGAVYQLDIDPGFTPTLLSVTSPWANSFGHPLTGAEVLFPECYEGELVTLQYLNFFAHGTSCPDSWIQVIPDAFGQAGLKTCDGGFFEASTCHFLGVNGSGKYGSFCSLSLCEYRQRPPRHLPSGCGTVSVKSKSWGAIKSIYQ